MRDLRLLLIVVLFSLPLLTGFRFPQVAEEDRTPPGSSAIPVQRVWEPNYQAFSLLIPQGWRFQGGMVYPDVMTAQAADLMKPKTNFTVSSPDGRVVFEWFEEVQLWSWGADAPPGAGLLSQLGSYNGMLISDLMDAVTFIERIAIPYRRPDASLQAIGRYPLPELAAAYQSSLPQLIAPGVRFHADAGMLDTCGSTQDERFVAVLTYLQMPGGVMWSNPQTFSWRAPSGQLARWEPLLLAIYQSLQLNPEWIKREILRQAQAGKTIAGVQDAIARIDGEIAAHRMATNQAIARQEQLNLFGYEEKTDPASGQTYIVPHEAGAVFTGQDGQTYYSEDPLAEPGDEFQRIEFQ